MKQIPVSNQRYILVDDEDFDWLNCVKWSVGGRGYAYYKNIKMHRLIMDAPADMFCDHINGNKLDNRKENLRLATNQQNLCNRKVNSNNTSGYKGVNYQHGKWYAKISVNSQQIHLGSYSTVIEAAKAYDAAAKRLHGMFASPNFSND